MTQRASDLSEQVGSPVQGGSRLSFRRASCHRHVCDAVPVPVASVHFDAQLVAWQLLVPGQHRP